MSDLKQMFPRVAIVADQMSAFGGADREMFSMLKVLPYADIYTIIFDRSKYFPFPNTVYTSFVQKISNILPKHFSRHLKIFTPLAYESFDLDGYDLVISISAGPGKGVITNIDQPHLAMVMTPPRSLWDKELNVRGSRLKSIYKPISILLNTYLRVWDWSISKRVDYWSSNSKYIAKKVKKRYGTDATVIYPGVEKKYLEKSSDEMKKKVIEKYSLPSKYILVVSRLYDHKRVDWAIRAAKEADMNLVIVGEGPDMGYLKKVSNGDERITFLGYVKDDMEVKAMYELSDVLIFSGLEDFGLVPVEAMASGTPILAYGQGGLLETVKEGVTGEFFQTEDELISSLINFDKRRYNKEKIIQQAKLFSEERFLDNFEKLLTQIYEKESKKNNQ